MQSDEDDWRAVAVPCVGSGLCCLKARCGLGVQLHGPGKECPSLVWKHEKYLCGEILKAEGEEAENLRKQLSVGAGCCMPLFNDLRAQRFVAMNHKQLQNYNSELVSLRRSSST